MATISGTRFEEWGVTFYEALEAARHNLEASDGMLAKIGDGFYASTTGDSYDASRLLMLDLVRTLDLSGEIIAMVPNRDSLFITGSDDVEGLGIMAQLGEKALSEPRPISAIPLRLEGDEWTSWMPDESHPTFQKFKMLEVRTMHGEYAEQNGLLHRLHEARGINDFIAQYSATQNQKTGEVSSYCVWADAAGSALLPKTHRVVFLRGEVVADAEWTRVRDVVGHLMNPIDLYPPRFRVCEFPSESELQGLRRP
jgi:hypothetical protein